MQWRLNFAKPQQRKLGARYIIDCFILKEQDQVVMSKTIVKTPTQLQRNLNPSVVGGWTRK